MIEPKYKIGQQFTSRGKGKIRNLYTITDIYRTYNSANELVRIRYVCTHEFMGQIVTNYDVIETTICRSLAE
jgi:hypothetical protein